MSMIQAGMIGVIGAMLAIQLKGSKAEYGIYVSVAAYFNSTFSSLIETIAKFEELGCTLDGIVKVKERYTHFGSDEHALIPAFKMTVKEA